MAKVSVTQALRTLRNASGSQALRHDAGSLPEGTLLIQKPVARKAPPLPEKQMQEGTLSALGQHIFMYHHIHTNQVVYSLTRHLSNKNSMAQIPFLGKKTKPAHLRKDVWLPYCMTFFPSAPAGMEAFRKLREYKRLHETEYDREVVTVKQGPKTGQIMDTKAKGKVLMNQKANSIADLAEVLLQQEDGPVQRRLDHAKRKMERFEQLERQKGDKNTKMRPIDMGKELKGTDGVIVRWADIRDAEFAEAWPQPVIHDMLLRSRYTAAFPEAIPESQRSESRVP